MLENICLIFTGAEMRFLTLLCRLFTKDILTHIAYRLDVPKYSSMTKGQLCKVLASPAYVSRSVRMIPEAMSLRHSVDFAVRPLRGVLPGEFVTALKSVAKRKVRRK